MQINDTLSAWSSLLKLVNFIEEKNTIGAGNRWFENYERFVINNLTNPDKIKPCNNLAFQQLHLRCINFNDWVIAFSIDLQSDAVLIEALLHKSRVQD